MIDAQTAYLQLARRVIVPVIGLASLFLVGLMAAIWLVAAYQTDTAQAEQVRLADSALSERSAYARKLVLDYSLWDEAFENLVAAPDADWADVNIGVWSFQGHGFDVALVVAPDGRITYETVRGAHIGRAFDTAISQGIEDLLRAARAGDGHSAVSGIVMGQGGPAILAASPIRRQGGGVTAPEARHLLVFIDILDNATLGQFARTYLLPHLRLEAPSFAGRPSVPLTDADGLRLGVMTWDGERPGDALLQVAVPAWVAVAVTFGLLIGLVGRQARSSARLLADSEHRASHDALTDLPNRLHLFERLDAASRALAGGGTPFAVAYLDLDGFKTVNDIHGHEAGDEILRATAKRMRKALAQGEVVARMGGDEFVLILSLERRDPPALERFLGQLMETIEQPVLLRGGAEAGISATIGLSLAPQDGADPLTLLRLADEALYLGKREGKRRATFHAGRAPALAQAA